ncbi:MAG: ABC transporter ATP-binding protein [Alphaproteobacteria bacterium]|nr:ABC transporter ATP-binding protein [Alphaproteobacteria bacterium]
MNSTKLPKSLWRFYFAYGARGHWGTLAIWFIAFLGVAADGVLFPMIERWFIALFEQTPPAGISFIEFAMPTIILCVSLFILIDLMNILRGVMHGRWNPKISNQISDILTDYVHHQSMSFWTGRMPGKINSQINYVATGFRTIEKFINMFMSMMIIIVNVGIVLNINKYVAFIFAAVFVFRMIYGLALLRPMNRSSANASDSSSTLSGKIVDSISNYSVVKLFAAATSERKYMAPHRIANIKNKITAQFFQRLFWAVPNIVWNFAFGGVMLCCVILYSRGEILVSEIVFTISVFFNVMFRISHIIGEIPDIVDNISSAHKSYTELVQPIDVMDADNAKILNVKHGEIEFRNVSFKYKNKYILRNLSLKIAPGTRIGLVGASGAGKTTLVNLLMRLYDTTSGDILVDGQNIRDVTQDSLRQNISFIPQEPTMFNRTLRENIAYGNPNATNAQIRHAARQAAADKFITATEQKYNSMVGDRGIKLSGGQRQRVAIARAFLKNAPILILDEATSALDSQTEVEIQKSFEKLARGRTTIAIAHRLSTLRNMDVIVVIERGRILEMGTHTQLIRRGGEYARLWKMQSGGFLQTNDRK